MLEDSVHHSVQLQNLIIEFAAQVDDPFFIVEQVCHCGHSLWAEVVFDLCALQVQPKDTFQHILINESDRIPGLRRFP